jgi:hypothetical protein
MRIPWGHYDVFIGKLETGAWAKTCAFVKTDAKLTKKHKRVNGF